MKKHLISFNNNFRKNLALRIIVYIFIFLIIGLSGYYGYNAIFNSEDNTKQIDNSNKTSNNYALKLNEFMDNQYLNQKIKFFRISGNITPSINPNLIFSEISKIESTNYWNATVWRIYGNPLNVSQEWFNFTDSDIAQIHTSFLASLDQTNEVPETQITVENSIPILLFFDVLYKDNTGLGFTWVSDSITNVLQIRNVTWEMTNYGVSVNYTQFSKYLSPLSAFDSFITGLRDLFDPYLK